MPSHKILSQSGVSLADVYDVEGSIVGVEELDADAVKTVHEMGATIASERMSGRVLLMATGAIAQNITFDQTLNLGADISRILNVQVIVDTVANLTSCSVGIMDGTFGATPNEMPLWAWTNAIDTERAIRGTILGANGNRNQLIPIDGLTGPTMLFGTGQPLPVATLTFRGVTSGFGAGTVSVSALIYAATPTGPSGLGNVGLPVPSW